jgi:glucose-1-phosphate thymidylyltransferase
LAEAFIIGEKFIGNENVCLILGDNIFFGIDTTEVKKNIENFSGGLIFAYQVNDPERYGVVTFDENKNVLDIQEKPKRPKSNYAVPGLYFYDNSVIDVAKNIKPSNRGELEITDVNKSYLENKKLKVQTLKRGVAWLDTGTFESLSQAGSFVQSIEDRQGLKIGCIEEIAYQNGWIDLNGLKFFVNKYRKNSYGEYIKKLIDFE